MFVSEPSGKNRRRSTTTPRQAFEDKVKRAARIIDEVIAEIEADHTSRVMLTHGVLGDVEARFKRAKKYVWYVEAMSSREWETLISLRLKNAGYTKFAWGWGGKSRRGNR